MSSFSRMSHIEKKKQRSPNEYIELMPDWLILHIDMNLRSKLKLMYECRELVQAIKD